MTNAADSLPSAVRPKSRWRKRLLRALVVLVFLLVVGEISLRLVLGLGSPLLYQLDPDCGYFPKPDQHIHRFFADNFINHEGMRSPEFHMPCPEKTFRALMVGDSVTYATTFVDQSLIWTSRLNRDLPGRLHKPVEILNASAGGWAPANEWGYLRSRGTFDANAVVFVVNTADIGEAMATITPKIAELFPQENPPSAIGETWGRYLKPRLLHHILSDPGTSMPAPDVLDRHIHANLRTYADAQAFAYAHHAAFAMIYIPFPGWHEPADAGTHKIILDWTAAHHVPLIDVLPRLSKEKVADISRDGIHPNARGDDVIADEVMKQWNAIDSATVPSATAPATQE